MLLLLIRESGWPFIRSRVHLSPISSVTDSVDRAAFCGIEDEERAVLSHRDKINFLRGDGSVQVFNVRPLVFDEAVGPELLQEVTARYEVCSFRKQT